jgi:hypothetical protein
VGDVGKALIGLGVLLVVAGLALTLAGGGSGRIPFLGRLPGDIHIQRGNWSIYFPLATSLVLSILLTLLLSWWLRR